MILDTKKKVDKIDRVEVLLGRTKTALISDIYNCSTKLDDYKKFNGSRVADQDNYMLKFEKRH